MTQTSTQEQEAVHLNQGMFTSRSDDWSTPQWLYDQLDAEFHFELDPCASHENHKAPVYFTEKEDGLAQDWMVSRVFCNPPYGREIGKWVKKAYEEAQKGCIVVCLLPARTDSRWWHDWCMRAREIRLVKGRLKFGGQTNSAPFPSAIVVFQQGNYKPIFSSLMRV